MTEIEIGRAKRGRQAYAFDDIAIVPSRRTRDPEEVSVAWQIDAYRFELPILAAPMDSVMSPATATALEPALVISSMTSDASSAAAMSLTTTVAPARAKPRASALPSPAAAPVTTATFPERSVAFVLLVNL